MTQETAKERIYREALEKTRDRLDGFEELYANKEVYYAFDELTGLVEKGLSQASKIPSSTDKLSVEKLQEQNKTMKLALVELSDENIYDNTGFFANEYAKNLVEQIDAGEIETIVERCIRNHQEQLNTAKKALTEIASTRQEIYRGGTLVGLELTEDAKIAHDALAAIGGDDGQ
ncbi:hypothetical protein [Lactococcus cremoris]|uniref:Uncharacterized protein n=3 Tax=Lactococcus lactis subsp. cremoris TaxID=1359 RepID=A0ABR5EDA4_LACLC|nr:hypothetical protein [Lactococcus cremoris]KEY61689.1 putative phage related protein [Lactococcus cremoris subsp. cremoris GE214]KKW69998.1 hypothetical protein VN93_2497 [Lactococcus cremoris]TNU81621.1 hypothetical protein FIB60_03410 [Lactococcus cremoris]